MFRKITLFALFAVAAVVTASSSQAANQFAPLTKTNNLTFSREVALPGVTLGAGTYVFESGHAMNPNIVRVMSQNRQRQFYLGFTVPIVRSKGAEAAVMTFGEASNGEAAPITEWYPVGSNSGHQFLYR